MTWEEFEKCSKTAEREWSEMVGGAQVKQTAEVILRMLEEGAQAGWISGDVQKEVPWSSSAVKKWFSARGASGGKLGVDYAWARGQFLYTEWGLRLFSTHATVSPPPDMMASLWWREVLVWGQDVSVLAKIKQNQSHELTELKSLYGVDPSPSMGQKGKEQ